jgi:hypothetical protein
MDGVRYRKPPTDKQLLKAARDFRTGVLDGRPSAFMCYAVSMALQGYLSWSLGVETDIVSADFPEINHYWLKLPDGRILDATADQFGLDPVYLGPLPLKYETRQARLADWVMVWMANRLA